MRGDKRYNRYERGQGFFGPFPLVPGAASIFGRHERGVYLLATDGARGELVLVRYVGRGYFRSRIASHARARRAMYYYVKPLPTETTAFEQECRLFYQYGTVLNLDNQISPAVPAGSAGPKCGSISTPTGAARLGPQRRRGPLSPFR